MNDWWLSTLVNLLANGMSQANAKAFVLTMIPTDQQTAAGTIIDGLMANCVTLAGLDFTGRTPAAGWHYLTSSPEQFYNHT